MWDCVSSTLENRSFARLSSGHLEDRKWPIPGFPNVGCLAVQLERPQSGGEIGEAAGRRRPIAASHGFRDGQSLYFES